MNLMNLSLSIWSHLVYLCQTRRFHRVTMVPDIVLSACCWMDGWIDGSDIDSSLNQLN